MKPTLSSISLSLFLSLCSSDAHEQLLKRNKYKSILKKILPLYGGRTVRARLTTSTESL